MVLGAALCKRGNINRMHGDEGRLDEFFLDELVKALVQGVTPSGLDLIHVDTGGLCGCNGFGIALDSHKVNADIFLDGLRHGQTLPARGEVNSLALPIALIGAED